MACVMAAPQLVSAEIPGREAQRPARMEHWRNQRFGLFVHWGPYSMLGGSYEGKVFRGNTEWIMRTAQISRQDYRRVSAGFDPKGYDPVALVDFAKKSGFRYLIFTAKHYDGFALFDSKASDFDSVDLLPSKRDLLKELSNACQSAGMPLGFSYSVQRDWYHPGGDTLGTPWDPSQSGSREAYLEKTALPQIKELMTGYGPVFALLPDSSEGLPPDLAFAFQEAVPPSVVTPRAFLGEGDYYYTDGNPLGRTIASIDWEQCRSMSDSWGFRKGRSQWKNAGEVLRELVQTASRGGNFLLNVGLDGEGKVPKEAQEALADVGRWLSLHGESIYGTSASPFMEHPWKGGATVVQNGDKSVLYLHLFGKEARQNIELDGLLTKPLEAEVMGNGRRLVVSGFPGHWRIDMNGVPFQDEITVLRLRLSGESRVGEGPVVMDKTGRFRLDLARGSFPSRAMKLERTPSSAELQVTGFSSPEEAGEWDLFAETETEVTLRLKADSGHPTKLLSISINDGEPVQASAEPNNGQPLVFKTSAIRLPAGMCRIRIAGAPPETSKDPLAAQPLSTSLIELIPTH